jgi:hypothetical protein
MRSLSALVLSGMAMLAYGAGAGTPDTPVWLADLAVAQEHARRDGRPILAVLH